ncbi:MAG: phosphatase PAP2 family protein [Bacteroidales bacterium]|nr:phosphatase PAP2 family protein [Bacteroidales bacterium]
MNDMKIRKHLDKLIFSSGLKVHILPLISSRYLYIGFFTLVAGALLNFASQTYLHNYMIEGKTLPMLSDLILDQLPVIDLSLIYDLFCLVIFAIVFIYIIHRKDYNRVPYFLVLCGIFFIIRGIFIILTPFGNPPHFQGSDPLFNGFSKYELGVYPSGHVGNSFLLLLLVKDRIYRNLLWFCLIVIVITLFISHGHYSIDIFSGFFFAYAIKSFGEKHLTMFMVKNHDGGLN